MNKHWLAVGLSLSVVPGAIALDRLLTRPGVADEPQSVHHIVLFDLKPTATEADIANMMTDGEAWLSRIPGVVDVQIGLKARDERDNHIKDYDVALYVELAQAADLDIYGPHPNHQAFVRRYTPLVEKFQVIDFYGD